jgi:hypothetical protein
LEVLVVVEDESGTGGEIGGNLLGLNGVLTDVNIAVLPALLLLVKGV